MTNLFLTIQIFLCWFGMCFSLVRCGYSFFQNVEIITISAWANDIPLAHSSDLHTSVHLIAANLATLMLNLSAFHALLHTFFCCLVLCAQKNSRHYSSRRPMCCSSATSTPHSSDLICWRNCREASSRACLCCSPTAIIRLSYTTLIKAQLKTNTNQLLWSTITPNYCTVCIWL